MKKTAFKQPVARAVPTEAENWVKAASDSAPTPAPAELPEEKPARLTIDLSSDLHANFKAACARRRTRMVDEVRQFIEEWTQKNS
jgi:uncharacterized protein (DUF4415 family)